MARARITAVDSTVPSAEEERQTLADQVETAAVTAISNQGLSIDEYNQVIASARDDAELEQRVLIACRAA